MTTSQEYSDYLHASDGTRLFYRQWHHPQARGAIVLVHGLGEHSGRYQALTEIFLQRGLSVRIYDQRGHGRSDGARGSLQHSDDYLSDLKLVFDDFAGQQACAPWLFGHSMGGLVAARFATGGLSVVQGLILSSPAMGIAMTTLQKILLAVSTRIAPAFAVPSSLPAQRLSHDAMVVRAYSEDRLNHGRVAARVVNFMLAAMQQVQRDAPAFTLPLLLQIAGDDAFVVPAASQSFFAQLPQGDKCIYCYQDAYHEIFNESAHYREQALRDLTAWLALHVPEKMA